MKKLVLIVLIILPEFAGAQIEKQWEAYYTPSNDTLNIQGTKTDAAGNLYTYGSEGSKLFLQKVSAQGNIEWTINHKHLIVPIPDWNGVIRPETENQNIEWAKTTDIATDSENVYLSGVLKYNNISERRCFIMKISPMGDTLWSRTYFNYKHFFDGDMENNARPQILIANDKLYLASLILTGSNDGIGGEDIFLLEIDKGSGAYGVDTNFSSQPVFGEYVAEFSSRNNFLYLSGSYYTGTGGFGDPTNGGWGTFIIKLDTGFNHISEGFEGHPASINQVIEHAIDNNGNMYVLAQTQDSVHSFNNSITCIKYNSSGSRLWRFDYSDKIASHDSALTFKIDNEGIVRIIGQSDNHNRAIFLMLDTAGILTNVLQRDSVDIAKHRIKHSVGQHWYCIGCPRTREITHTPTINLEISAYYFSLKNSSSGISKTYKNSAYWWDVDTTKTPEIVPVNITFIDTFDFITTSLTNILTDKKIHYIKYRDTSWLKTPYNITATALSLHEIRLEWNAHADYKNGFVIERSTDGILFQTVDTITSDSLAYTDSGLNNNAIYYYQVKTINQYGTSVPSDIAFDTTLNNVGINAITHVNITIYPNPFNSILYIELSIKEAAYELVLYDIQGKEIKRQVVSEPITTVETKELNKGLYLINIQNLTDNQSYTFKVLKL